MKQGKPICECGSDKPCRIETYKPAGETEAYLAGQRACTVCDGREWVCGRSIWGDEEGPNEDCDACGDGWETFELFGEAAEQWVAEHPLTFATWLAARLPLQEAAE